jgi:hypothetical protein
VGSLAALFEQHVSPAIGENRLRIHYHDKIVVPASDVEITLLVVAEARRIMYVLGLMMRVSFSGEDNPASNKAGAFLP